MFQKVNFNHCSDLLTCLQSQLVQILFHLLLYLCQFNFDIRNIFLHRLNIYRNFLFKSIHIAGNVQIVVVLPDFIQRCTVAVFRFL